MRIGLIGPAADATAELSLAVALLLRDRSIRHVLYLGEDDAIDQTMASLGVDALEEDVLLDRAIELALSGGADEIDALLRTDREARRSHAVRKLPRPPARAIEMLERYMVIAVHDKAVLDEDDIANAHVIVYGKADAPTIKRFGPRTFFTPGPLRLGHLGTLTVSPEGRCEVSVLDLQGKLVRSEMLELPGGKVVVTA